MTRAAVKSLALILTMAALICAAGLTLTADLAIPSCTTDTDCMEKFGGDGYGPVEELI